MPEQDIFKMNKQELKKLEVVKKIKAGEMKQKTGAQILEISTRQVRRLQKRVDKDGIKGVIHGNRGKVSPRKISDKQKEKILELRREKYYDFRPTFMSEKLEDHGITVSKETLRKILLESGDWQLKVKKKKHRKWRERKEHFGEMLQFDGSHHPWLEKRGPKMVLMKFVDDATSMPFGRFYKYEGTRPAMDLTIRYIKKYGIPRQIYADRHSTYKSPREATIEEQLNGEEPKSEYGRVVNEVGINLINANSPQAKGRVERNFGVDQDRLVKELRLANICNMEDANKFLETYWTKHYKKFGVKPANEEDLHVPLPAGTDLYRIFRERKERTVRNDNTVQYAAGLYQIESNHQLYGKKVYVETDLKDRMFIKYKSFDLDFKQINPKKIMKPEKKRLKIKRKTIVLKNHPWRSNYIPELDTRV